LDFDYLHKDHARYLQTQLIPKIIEAQEKNDSTTTLTITIRKGKIIGQACKEDLAIR
jgi:hypothetical protein